MGGGRMVKQVEVYPSGTNPFEKKNDGRVFKYYNM
jgi:hypothetical protein